MHPDVFVMLKRFEQAERAAELARPRPAPAPLWRERFGGWLIAQGTRLGRFETPVLRPAVCAR